MLFRSCQLPFHTSHRRGNVNSPSPESGNVNSPFTLRIEEGMSTPLHPKERMLTLISPHKRIGNVCSHLYSHFAHNRECLFPLLPTLRTELGMSTHLHFLSILTHITHGPSLSRCYQEAVDPPKGPRSLKGHGLPGTRFLRPARVQL